MTYIVEGRYVTEEEKEILDRMVENAEENFGRSLSEDQLSTVRVFYLPLVRELAELQNDIRVVLDSAQIDHASGEALDLLCALINVSRREAEHATGTVTMSRSTAPKKSYIIPEGTSVQTDANTTVRFETVESVTLPEGSTSIEVPVRAKAGGTTGNVASNTITIFESKPSGIEEVNNSEPMSGGKEREGDDQLRERAKKHLAQGSAATAPAILSEVSASSDEIVSVTVNKNDTDIDYTPSGGLPPHSIEVVVEAPSTAYDDVARAIVENKAAGIEDYGGASGSKISRTVEVNGDDYDVNLSSPTVIDTYVNIEVEVESNYAGDSDVIDRAVEYIGGFLSDGSPQRGELNAGHDVLYGEVEYAVRDVTGVYDVSVLEVDTADPPSGSADISIGETEVAKLNGQNDITVTTTEI